MSSKCLVGLISIIIITVTYAVYQGLGRHVTIAKFDRMRSEKHLDDLMSNMSPKNVELCLSANIVSMKNYYFTVSHKAAVSPQNGQASISSITGPHAVNCS